MDALLPGDSRDGEPSLRRLFPPVLVVSYGVVFVMMAAVGAAAFGTGRTVDLYTADPLATAELPFYVGSVTTLGLLVLAGTAGICALAAALLSSDRAAARFFWASFAATSWILVDDWLMLHEIVAPQYFGIPELLASAVVAAVIVGYVFYVRDAILEGETWLLLLAAVLGALSQFIDLGPLPNRDLGVYRLVEDTLKLLAIVTWGIWLGRAAIRALATSRRVGGHADGAA